MKKNLFSFLIVMLYVSFFSFAQELFAVDEGVSTEITSESIVQDDVDGEPLEEMVLLANVEFENVVLKQDSRDDQTYKINFDLHNYFTVQSGVRYAVQLIDDDEGSQRYNTVVDQKVYDDVVDIGEKEKISKEITYTIPAYFNGLYRIALFAQNESALTLAIYDAGQVIANGSEDYIKIDRCILKVSGTKEEYMADIGMDVRQDEKLIARCIVQNTFQKEKTVVPNFKTTWRSQFGQVVKQEQIVQQPIVIRSGENKEVHIEVPKALQPQAYDAVFTLTENGKIVSNQERLHYVIAGESATIQNITLDKKYYEKGEIAQISFFWEGSADQFTGARTGGTRVQSPQAQIDITDKKGKRCIDPVENYSLTDGSVLIEREMKINCEDPQVVISLYGTDNMQLDTKTLLVSSGKDSLGMHDKASLKSVISWIVIIIITLIVIIVLWFIIKKNRGVSVGLFIFIASTLFAMMSGSIQAATYGGDHTIQVTVSGVKSDCYDPNSSITASVTSAVSSHCSNYTYWGEVWATTPPLESNYSKLFGTKSKTTSGHSIGSAKISGTTPASLGTHYINFKVYAYQNPRNTNCCKPGCNGDDCTKDKKMGYTFRVPYCVAQKKVDAKCGTAARTFSWSASGWGSYVFCEKGTVGTKPSFPDYGKSVSWTCNGIGGGSSAKCAADRQEPPEPKCGTNDQTTIAWDATQFLGTWCESGTLDGDEPQLPAYGESVSWTCSNDATGVVTTPPCTAKRDLPPKCECNSAVENTLFNYKVSMPTGQLCIGGTPSPANPLFPGQYGGTVTWTCGGADCTGEADNCSANRGNPVDCKCGDANGKDNLTGPPSSDLCAVGDTSSVSGTNTWDWTCGTGYSADGVGGLCLTQAICEAECLDVDLIAPEYAYVGDGETKEIDAYIQITGNMSYASEIICSIDGTSVNFTGNKSDVVKIPITQSTTIRSSCRIRVDCGNSGNGDYKEYILDKGINALCMQRSCNAQGSCQATPQNAASGCTSTCNSDADCSRGRMIETRP